MLCLDHLLLLTLNRYLVPRQLESSHASKGSSGKKSLRTQVPFWQKSRFSPAWTGGYGYCMGGINSPARRENPPKYTERGSFTPAMPVRPAGQPNWHCWARKGPRSVYLGGFSRGSLYFGLDRIIPVPVRAGSSYFRLHPDISGPVRAGSSYFGLDQVISGWQRPALFNAIVAHIIFGNEFIPIAYST